MKYSFITFPLVVVQDDVLCQILVCSSRATETGNTYPINFNAIECRNICVFAEKIVILFFVST